MFRKNCQHWKICCCMVIRWRKRCLLMEIIVMNLQRDLCSWRSSIQSPSLEMMNLNSQLQELPHPVNQSRQLLDYYDAIYACVYLILYYFFFGLWGSLTGDAGRFLLLTLVARYLTRLSNPSSFLNLLSCRTACCASLEKSLIHSINVVL